MPPTPAYRDALKGDASQTVRRMSALLEGTPAERVRTVVVAEPLPAHALHDLAEAHQASIVVVGATRTGPAGRVLPGATAERLLQAGPCPVAVVPEGYPRRWWLLHPPHRRRVHRLQGGQGGRRRRRRGRARSARSSR